MGTVQKQNLESQTGSMELLVQNVKEILKFEQMQEKTNVLENTISKLQTKIFQVERMKTKRNSKVMEEDGFIIDMTGQDEPSKPQGGYSLRKHGGGRYLTNWLAKQYGGSCC